MSRFFSRRFASLVPYTPGEQPHDRTYIKLNTNESPFPPSPGVAAAVAGEVSSLRLYSDPTCRDLSETIAALYGIAPDEVMLTNGSDEVLNFSFMAFADEDHPLLFPSVTYGFYPVFAELLHIPYEEIPLKPDFTVCPGDYLNRGGSTIVLANPNAPTGLALSHEDIRDICRTNPDGVVIVDEAYVDFGCESVVPLIREFDNLLVTQTFSKSRSMAGARLGFGIGSPALIADLETIRYSTNPYNVNRLTAAAGLCALSENDYYMKNCRTIIENRAYTAQSLRTLGFDVTDSMANFVFARSNRIGGEALYRKLKERGILVRHFDKDPIREYNRITIGTREQMDIFLTAVRCIVEEVSV